MRQSGLHHYQKYAWSIAAGAFVGLASTVPTSIIGGVLAGGFGSAFNEVINTGIGAKKSSLNDSLQEFLVGAAAGGVGNAFGLAGGYLVKTESQIGKQLSQPLPTYGEVGGSIGITIGTVWANY